MLSTGGGKGCLAGQKICVIDVKGNVLPCSYFPLSAGNLNQESLSSIWSESTLFQQLRDFKSYQDRCGQCEFIKVCGGCRARAYTMTGNHLAQEPFCQHQPKQAYN
ncbi:SPASM domain-containing protein [Piscirickettsia litoralis]|uniref:SPASM domain-containing protein n=1 Tax=Piscirickettsia litoralis TaxID=1891921 RepID=UPI001F329A38|nr:SPASM domain-containing protein [Piscirickettsia litoralis]